MNSGNLRQNNVTEVKMYIAIDEAMVEQIATALNGCRIEIQKLAEREAELKKQAKENQLLTPEQAREYLGGIGEQSLTYYEKHDLPFYSKGKFGKWYRKADIDEWLESGKVNRHKK